MEQAKQKLNLMPGVVAPLQRDKLLDRTLRWLIVMDALRVDYYTQYYTDGGSPDGDVETVRSMAGITYRWINHFARLALREQRKEILFFTANPVCARELANYKGHAGNPFRVVPLYEYLWGKHGTLQVPTVHPCDVNAAVQSYIEAHGMPEFMVVWYIQPHAPYIGKDAIPYMTWGMGMKDDLSVEVRKLDYLKKAARAGKITDDQIKAAYAGNVDVVVPLARKLALSLPGKGAITADHGEMLGEHGEYEHAAPPIYPQLLNVPWHRYVNPPCPVSKIPDHIGRELFDVGSDATRGKLRALGYI